MSLTYSTYVGAIQTLAASNGLDTNFFTILPDIIDYAELRILRELDLLSTVVVDDSVTLTVSERAVTIPNTFVVTNGFNVLTPVGSTAETGTRVPLTPVSRNVLDVMWPGNGTVGVPQVYAMTTQWNVVLGPAPDAAYLLETIGTIRPASLSPTNTTTFITQYLPDLFVAASMIFVSMYQRNWDAAGNAPGMGGNWEAQYEHLFQSANTEEARKKLNSNGWTSYNPAPLAQAQR